MASEIEIVNLGNFEKIQNFLNDSAYKEILENSENFNTRLCIERRLRMPFLDPQTGVAQTHCALFVKQKQRMPGFRDGQIYTYPASRWRKPKRQYLLNHHHSYRAYQYRELHHHVHHPNYHHHGHVHQHQSPSAGGTRDHHAPESTANLADDGNSMGTSGETDNKDALGNSEKEWFHEDMDSSHYHHADEFEDDFDSDNDFDESYSSRGKRKRASRSSRRSNVNLDGTPKRGRKGGGSRRRNIVDGETTDRRRRGGGGGGSSGGSGGAVNSLVAGVNTTAAAAAAAAAVAHAASTAAATNLYTSHSNSASPIPTTDETSQSAHGMQSNVAPSSYDKTNISGGDGGTANDSMNSVGSTNATMAGILPIPIAVGNFPTPAAAGGGSASPKKDGKSKVRSEREVAQPSPYCDFCLGDQRENKKTNLPEELVSCSDCGRSGHPSCLQFTPNMIISVKRYRWQCIECKYCSICGTSDNDDQLLFCDDCDRGYHMYCLSPPLVTPPEGSWSCKLCIEEFHKHDKQ